MNSMYKSFFVGGLLLSSPFITSAAEPATFALNASIELSNTQLDANGGYLNASVNMENVGDIDANIKYWISVKGPQGLSFPAKAVVNTNSSEFEVDEVEEGASLAFNRGIWIHDYMNNGDYVVSLEGVNTDTGDIFQYSAEFTKGTGVDGTKKVGDLEVNAQLIGADNFPVEGGYTTLSFAIDNTGMSASEVEFWINAQAPNGLDIPVFSRVSRVLQPGDNYFVVRGFWLDENYPNGEYIIKPQLYNKQSGKRVEYELKVYKGEPR